LQGAGGGDGGGGGGGLRGDRGARMGAAELARHVAAHHGGGLGSAPNTPLWAKAVNLEL